jgi:hypothetical protein
MMFGRAALAVVVVSAALVSVPTSSATAGCAPTLRLLPGLGGAISEARATSPRGVVVGTASTPDGDIRAVWWDRGRRVHPIETGSGLADSALDVNQYGAMVGIADDLELGLTRAWHRSARGEVTFLPVPPGTIGSYAARINASGVAVGYVFFADERFAAAVWASSDRPPRLLPLPSGFTQAVAFGVDETGRVSGAVGTSAGEFVPALWRRREPALLDRRPGTSYAVNNQGQAVGSVGVGDRDQPARWPRRGGAQVLPAAGVAHDISQSGRVTGTIEDRRGAPRAFLWDRSGAVRLLPALAGGATGYGVDDRGMVAGFTDDGEGTTRAALWTCA